jgi:hypothetical protein
MNKTNSFEAAIRNQWGLHSVRSDDDDRVCNWREEAD